MIDGNVSQHWGEKEKPNLEKESRVYLWTAWDRPV